MSYYPSKGIVLLPPEHVARRDVEKENKRERKSKGNRRLPHKTCLKSLLTAGGRVSKQNMQLELWQ